MEEITMNEYEAQSQADRDAEEKALKDHLDEMAMKEADRAEELLAIEKEDSATDQFIEDSAFGLV